MDLLKWLDPTRWIVLGLIALALVAGYAEFVHHQRSIGYQRRAAEDKAAADAQTTRNLELQRASEKRYIVRREGQDQFFTQTITEVRYAAAPLASCPLPADLVRLLNDSAHCASDDTAASCSPAGKVPGSR